MINGHGDDAYRYTAIHANFSSNVYHRVNHDGLNRYLAGCLPCIRSYPEPEPYALAAEPGPVAWCQSGGSLCDEWSHGSHLPHCSGFFAEVILLYGYRPLVNMPMPAACTDIGWKVFPVWRN